MRTAVLHAVHDLRLEDRPAPEPGPGEVLIRVTAVGVCGSDTHYFTHGRIGSFVVEQPLVLGHEAAGVIEAVGEGVPAGRAGQRVSIEPGTPDFTCEQCREGRYNLCPAMSFHATPPVDGSLSELVTVPAGLAYPLPDHVSDVAGAMIEPLSVGVWSCRRAGVGPGSRVLITGAGPIGLLAAQVALASGAAAVAVADIDADRLAVALEAGAHAIFDLSEATLAEVYASGPEGHPASLPPTVLLECSGHAGTTRAALEQLAPAGTAVLVGMGGDEITLPLSLIQERELTVTGTFRYANTWPAAIALVASGAVRLDHLVTGHFALAETEQALLAGQQQPGAIKSIIRPQE